MLLHSSNLDKEMYDLQDEGFVWERLGIHQLLSKCDHWLTLVHHLINNRYHPLLHLCRIRLHLVLLLLHNSNLDCEVYGLEEERLIGNGLNIHMFLDMHHRLHQPATYWADSYYTYGGAIHPICSTTCCIITTTDKSYIGWWGVSSYSKWWLMRTKEWSWSKTWLSSSEVWRGKVCVNLIESIVEHAYHGRPQRKGKTHLCGTHWGCYYIWLVFWILLVFCISLFWTNTHNVYLYLLYFGMTFY